VWKLDRLGRDLRHLDNIVHDLTERGIGLKVLTGQGAAIDTTTASGKLIFGIFAALAEFERELICERTLAGRARGRKGGRPYKMTPAKLRLAMASMGKPGTKVSDLCTELGITRQTLYEATCHPRANCAPTGKNCPPGTRCSSVTEDVVRFNRADVSEHGDPAAPWPERRWLQRHFRTGLLSPGTGQDRPRRTGSGR